jgi:hypothetical protein
MPGGALERLLAEKAEHDCLLIDDDAGIAAISFHSLPDLGERLTGQAGRHCVVGNVAKPDLVDGTPLSRPILFEPCLLPGDVVGDLEEAEAL